MSRSLTFVYLLVIFLIVLAAPVLAQDAPEPLPERGPYRVGSHTFTLTDESRGGREIPAIIWYPAADATDLRTQFMRAEMAHIPVVDASPDFSGAPYPIVLYSHRYLAGWYGSPTEFREVLEPLVSQGFVVVNLSHPDTDSIHTIVDRPLDAKFVLDQLESINADPASGYTGLMNTDQAGAVSFSEGAFTTLALSGAQMDPAVAEPYMTTIAGLYAPWFKDWDWAELDAYHEQVAPGSDGALWPALSDPRIRAVVHYEPCNVGMWGEQGLASATAPTLLIAGSEAFNPECEYENSVVAYQQLGPTERDLLTMIGGTQHVPTGRDMPVSVVQQYLHAFFGYHLQGKADYADYLTEDFANTIPNALWGVAQDSVTDLDLSTFDFMPGGTVRLGEPAQGAIEHIGDRVGYSLTLDADSTLDVMVPATGNAAEGTLLDSVLYVVDASGSILFWNDELSLGDPTLDAGIEGLALPAGAYTLVVGALDDEVGPFTLSVDAAQ